MDRPDRIFAIAISKRWASGTWVREQHFHQGGGIDQAWFVNADIADRHKAQRDRLLDTLQGILRDGGWTESDAFSIGKDCLDAVNAAIAECDEADQ